MSEKSMQGWLEWMDGTDVGLDAAALSRVARAALDGKPCNQHHISMALAVPMGEAVARARESRKHTPEPWRADRGVVSRGLEVIAVCHSNGTEIFNENGKIDASRIVACVNACRGIDTEELEALEATADQLQDSRDLRRRIEKKHGI
jgi:hypothetical protein